MNDELAAPPTPAALAAALGDERARLTRLCARLTGDADAAEDLAQEALLEAWRAAHRLRDADGLAPWLAAIARNVCLRWARARGRELARRATPLAIGEDADGPVDGASDLDAMRVNTFAVAADAGDFTVELERQELATLLDRALGSLPPETRLALVESAVYATPQAEIAARLGLSEGALRVRLSRGRLALRNALTTDLRGEAEALGLRLPTGGAKDESATDGWRATRIWCPFCGRQTLDYRIQATCGAISFRCAGRCLADGTVIGGADGSPILPEDVKLTSPKVILSRALLSLGAHYSEGIGRGALLCGACGRRSPVHIHHPEHPASTPFGAPDDHLRAVYSVCLWCGAPDSASVWHLMLDMPQAQRFWRAHPRMRATPERHVEVNGVPAIITSFESLGERARLDAIVARDTLATLAVYESNGD